ncbi:MAG TPA: peptidoglycan DD-metalloendopeptidase family protein [Kofleriaceae bacterium]|nr:peptidoglycan DD-metalloendopeptidase family protein [Kofleriaceae bacterium]
MTAIALSTPGIARGDGPERGDPAEAARKLEGFFVRQFLALARPQEPGMLDGGFAGDTFKEMLDGAIADAVTDGGGLGLAATFEGALGGEQKAAVRPGAPTMLDHLDGMRALEAARPAGPALPPAQPAPGAVFIKPASGRFSSGFGFRIDPLGAGKDFHPGLDIAAPAGAPVVAAGSGKVIHAGPAGTYGNMIAIRHADGTETRYAHLSEVDVKVGQQIEGGAFMGKVGSTGRSTGPHLHFEVRRDGKAVDPRPFLDGPTATPATGGHRDGLTDRISSPSPSIVGIDGRP